MELYAKENDRNQELGYYGICTLGGMFSAGVTHLVTTPFDVLKVNMQINPAKYSRIAPGLSILCKEHGPSSLWRGWSGKLIGYGMQGGFKFGLYEYFKTIYSQQFPYYNPTSIFFISSASAQLFADVALCPFEAVKVRVQAHHLRFARGLTDGIPKIYRTEGLSGLYRGLLPLWGRNLPFSVVMFSTFEHSAAFIYDKIMRREKEECSRMEQIGVTCLAGYTAGTMGCVISNPADNVVSNLNNGRAKNVIQAIKSIGLRNLLTRSLPIRVALVGPVVTMQWFLYDSIKLLCGLPTSGGISRKDSRFRSHDDTNEHQYIA